MSNDTRIAVEDDGTLTKGICTYRTVSHSSRPSVNAAKTICLSMMVDEHPIYTSPEPLGSSALVWSVSFVFSDDPAFRTRALGA